MVLGYCNMPELFDCLYPWCSLYATSLAGMAHEAKIDLEPTFWPSAPAIRAHLRPEITTAQRTPHGLQLTCRYSLPTGGANGPLWLIGLSALGMVGNQFSGPVVSARHCRRALICKVKQLLLPPRRPSPHRHRRQRRATARRQLPVHDGANLRRVRRSPATVFLQFRPQFQRRRQLQIMAVVRLPVTALATPSRRLWVRTRHFNVSQHLPFRRIRLPLPPRRPAL